MKYNKNNIIPLIITGIAGNGSGVARTAYGQAVFVPFTAVGDEIEARVLKVTSNLIYAKLERLITASPDRVNTGCEVFGRCGGCDFRHISYEAELRAKSQFIRDAFTKIGGLTPEFLPVIPSGNTERYRNKAQYPVRKTVPSAKGTVQGDYGFFAPGSHRIVSSSGCKLQPEIFSEIADYIISKNISPYDEAAHTGVLRHICIRKGHSSGEVNVCLVARRKIPEFMKLAHSLMQAFPSVKGVALNINKAKTNVIFGDEEYVLKGADTISDTMCGVKVRISPRSFYQVNTPTAEKLYGLVHEFTQPEGKVVLDLYCGIGTIGLSMAHRARQIIGVEAVESSVLNARENAALNGFKNISFIHGDASSDIGVKPDIIILDPARKGCAPDVIENAAALNPERIIMVSCNPATAARDCARLAELGYITVKTGGADLFPRTRHVECVIALCRSDCL